MLQNFPVSLCCILPGCSMFSQAKLPPVPFSGTHAPCQTLSHPSTPELSLTSSSNFIPRVSLLKKRRDIGNMTAPGLSYLLGSLHAIFFVASRMLSRGVSRFPRQLPLFPLGTSKRLSVTPTVYDLMSIFSTVFVFDFLENDKRNGNLHGHIVRVNEAYQQSRREDPDEVPLEEQITTVNEGRPKRNDIVSQCLPVALVTTDFSRLRYNIIQHEYDVVPGNL